MKKIRLLMTHNRCIFLHCFSFRACGLGFVAREVLDKKSTGVGAGEMTKMWSCSEAYCTFVMKKYNVDIKAFAH